MELNKQIDFSAIAQKKWTQSQFFKIFCCIMLGGICLFLLSLVLLGVERWRYLFFIFQAPDDSFMDFFNPLYWVQFKDIYSWRYADYPALSYLIFGLFSHIVPANVLKESAVFIRGNVYGIAALSAFLGTFLISFFAVIFKNKSGTVKEKLLFCLLILFSAPFLFSVERGNIMFVSLFFTTFFIFYYDSPKRYLRELSLVFLACAAAMKIYPAAIGILLLKDKRYKDILRLGIYTVCLFVLPFFFYNGIADMKRFLHNISGNSGWYSKLSYGYSANIYTTLKMIVCAVTQQEYLTLNIIFRGISYLALFVGGTAAYFISKKWKTVAVACLLMVLVPPISAAYILLFLIPPLVLFLNDKEERGFKDLIYLILFAIIFMLNIPAEVPMYMPRLTYVGLPVLADNFCERFACLIMFIMLCRDGIKDFKVRNK